jgi:hypothetical protein
MKQINSFDMDGVITIGIYPGPDDIIITGRSFEESKETLIYLHNRGIYNAVFFNPLPYDKKDRVSSGRHKARIIRMLMDADIYIKKHFEDDEVQIAAIKESFPNLPIVHIVSNLVNKENVRHECEEVVNELH